MPHERTIVISGRSTVGESRNDVTTKMLIFAARLTLDHGFRYFRVVGSPNASTRQRTLSIFPGADVTIEVYRDGEISQRSPGIWDAENIGAGDLPGNSP